jgi:hypothetical protein
MEGGPAALTVERPAQVLRGDCMELRQASHPSCWTALAVYGGIFLYKQLAKDHRANRSL